jgi:hypothetical protein
VIIIKIGQSAANLRNSLYLNNETQSDNLEELEDQSLLEEEIIESQQGSSETTRENELNKPRNIVNKPTLSNHRPHHRYPSNDEQLGYYLAGLIDGDRRDVFSALPLGSDSACRHRGYISSEISQPTITITFNKKDTFLAYKIKSLLGYGSVRCYSSYSIYTITNREGLIKMIYLIHNKLRLYHKVNRLNNLIKRYNLPLMKSIPDNSNVTLTHYLAGLLDSDGSLSIKLLKRVRCLSSEDKIEKVDKVEVRLLARVELNSILGSNVINNLKENLGGSINLRLIEYEETSRLGERVSKSLSWSSVSFDRMYNLLIYLDKYNLCSKKYLEYLYIRKAYIIIQNNQHLTLEGQKRLSYYKQRISDLKHCK